MSPIPAGPYLPNSGLVAQAWLGQRVDGLTPSMVAAALPRDVTAWADQGFVQATIVPGTPDMDTGARAPLVQVDCWAVALNAGAVSTKPPVYRAWRLAELIVRATENDRQSFGLPVVLPANYLPARVQSVRPVTEPSEVPGDPSGYARITLDLALDWVRL